MESVTNSLMSDIYLMILWEAPEATIFRVVFFFWYGRARCEHLKQKQQELLPILQLESDLLVPFISK